MEPKSSEVEARPPVLTERIVRFLTPPAAREGVVGDLSERYRSPAQYGWDATTTLPFVVASQIRRSSSLPVLGLQTFILFACLGGFVVDVAGPPNWAIAIIPTTAAFIGLLIRDAYRGTDRRSIRRAIFDAITAIACVAATQVTLALLAATTDLDPRWMLAPQIMVLALLAIPMLCILRFGLGLDGESHAGAGDGHTTLRELALEYGRFQRRIRGRTIAELIAGVLCMALSAYFLWRFNPLVAPYGWAMLAGHTIAMGCIAFRGWVRPIPAGASFSTSLAFYGHELSRLRRMRRYLWWWYFVPLFVGLTTNLIAPGIATSQPVRILLGVGSGLLLCLCIAGLNHDRNRRVQERIDALGVLKELPAA
jgi:hypothetical protein